MTACTYADIADITWEIGPNLPEFRKGGCATALDNKVISVFGMRQPWGEMDTMYVYDPVTNWWSRGLKGPVGQCYVQGAECGGAFYAIGGRKGSVRKECYRLSIEDGAYRWSKVPPLNDARGWAPSAAVDGKIYVFGGAKGGHGPTLKSVEMVDTNAENPAWRVVSEIPGISRGWLGCAAVGGKLFILGGYHFFEPKPSEGTDRKRVREVLEFDPVSGEWRARKPLPYPLSGMDTCVYRDRYIIVVGGACYPEDYSDELRKRWEESDRYESYYCPFVLVYDTQEDTWSVLPSLMPVPTNDIRVVLLNNRLYALGGENIEPATSNTTPWLRIGAIVE
jgi:N-acetylneuraminic acid mutarotase